MPQAAERKHYFFGCSHEPASVTLSEPEASELVRHSARTGDLGLRLVMLV